MLDPLDPIAAASACGLRIVVRTDDFLIACRSEISRLTGIRAAFHPRGHLEAVRRRHGIGDYDIECLRLPWRIRETVGECHPHGSPATIEGRARVALGTRDTRLIPGCDRIPVGRSKWIGPYGGRCNRNDTNVTQTYSQALRHLRRR